MVEKTKDFFAISVLICYTVLVGFHILFWGRYGFDRHYEIYFATHRQM